MRKVLVTGGAGYIGSTIAHLLARRGNQVTILDDLSRGHEHNIAGLPFQELNLLNTPALIDLLGAERFDAVLHFAAYIAVGESTEKPELYFSNNVGGTLSLLDAMNRAGVRRLVFSSTAAVYGMPDTIPIPETAPIKPINPYGESKATVERVLGWLDRCSGLRSVALRYFNACGSDPESGLGEEHSPETHLIPLLFRAAITGRPISIFGNDYDTPDGTCIRDYIHVVDLAEAHVLALEALLAGSHSDAFNVGTGTGHSVMEVIRAVEEVTGHRVPFEIGARRAGDSASLVANSDKLKRTLGWTPKFPALSDMVATAWQFEKKRGPGGN
jgi:UDP-glucose 4-epimerase